MNDRCVEETKTFGISWREIFRYLSKRHTAYILRVGSVSTFVDRGKPDRSIDRGNCSGVLTRRDRTLVKFEAEGNLQRGSTVVSGTNRLKSRKIETRTIMKPLTEAGGRFNDSLKFLLARSGRAYRGRASNRGRG